MLRLDDKIRLTKQEQANFDNLAGQGAAPKTVQEHDEILEKAAEAYDEESKDLAIDMSAEAELLAMLCRDAKIED